MQIIVFKVSAYVVLVLTVSGFIKILPLLVFSPAVYLFLNQNFQTAVTVPYNSLFAYSHFQMKKTLRNNRQNAGKDELQVTLILLDIVLHSF